MIFTYVCIERIKNLKVKIHYLKLTVESFLAVFRRVDTDSYLLVESGLQVYYSYCGVLLDRIETAIAQPTADLSGLLCT